MAAFPALPSRLRRLLFTPPLPLVRRCPICGRPVETDRLRLGLCADCAQKLRPRLGGHCPACGAIFGDGSEAPTACAACRREKRPWDGFVFHAAYAGLLRDIVLEYKFGRRMRHVRVLRGLLAAAVDAAQGRRGPYAPRPPHLIVPVPLHPRRLKWRGFNQSLELARPLSRGTGAPLSADALRRVRDTIPQSTLDKKQRLDNIKGAFAAGPAAADKNVWLVDDVATTGATIEAAAKALKKAGAARVDVLVVGR